MKLPLKMKKEEDMKKQAFGILTMLTLVLMLTAASVHAQSSRSSLNIPFSFTVGHKTLPAGEYTVEPIRKDSHIAWLIQTRIGRHSVLFTTTAGRAGTQEETRLVFNKYDRQYFLSQIWTPADNLSRELPMRRVERALAKSVADREKVVVTPNEQMESN